MLQKPELAPAHFASEPGTGAANANHEKEKRTDVFKPPYNPNLYIGELRDEEEGNEYVVLVSGVHDHPITITSLTHHHHLDRSVCAVRHDRRDTYAFAFAQLNKYSVVEEHFLLVTKGVFSSLDRVVARASTPPF